MNATQKFIEDAIKGGWQDEEWHSETGETHYKFDRIDQDLIEPRKSAVYIDIQWGDHFHFHVADILLDPLAWEAYVKTKLNGIESPFTDISTEQLIKGEAKRYMHRFIDHLADGKTIDQSLTAIE